jgi:hypothetical protein
MWMLNHRPSGPQALAALLAGCWLIAGICRADDTLPKGFDVARYQQIWERNPFTLVTPSLGQGPASPFSKLILVNWLHDKGKDILFVEDTETNEVKKVTKDDSANSDRLRLIEVVSNPNPSLIVAKLSNGREEGVVKFRFEQPQTNQMPTANIPGQRFLPGQVGANNQFGNNAPGPVRRMPQMPPTAMAGQNVPQQTNNVNAPDTQEIRRRRMLPTPAQNQVPVQAPQVQAPQVQPQLPQNNAQQNNNASGESDDDE